MAGYFELTRAGAGFNFNLRAGNGEVVLSSQVYRSKASARKGVSAVQLNGRDPARCQPRTASNGQPYFVLLAANGKVIAQSEMYASTQDVMAELIRWFAMLPVRKSGT